MSIEALNWLRTQHTGSPGAQLVLMVLCDYANQDGETFAKLETLARRTEQSADTVRRKLRQLEAEGFIERREQFRSNGSNRENLYCLMMSRAADPDPDVDETTLADCKGTPPEDGAVCKGEGGTGARGRVATVPPPEPTFNHHRNLTPHSPPVGGVSCEETGIEGRGDGSQLDALIEAFKAADPSLVIDRPAARRAWAKLTAADQVKAIAGLPTYLEMWRKRGHQLRTPSSYLKGRIWTDFALVPPRPEAVARPEPDAIVRAVDWARSPPQGDWVFVPYPSDEWDAWAAAFRHAGRNMLPAGNPLVLMEDGTWANRRGRSFPVSRPPSTSDPPNREAAE